MQRPPAGSMPGSIAAWRTNVGTSLIILVVLTRRSRGMRHLRARSYLRALLTGFRVWNLRSCFAAVDADDLAGDERRLAGSDEHDGICDLRGGAHTLERYSRDQSGLSLGGAGGPIQQFGFDGAGRYRIYANA